jgi:hypothetical protein
LAPDALVFYLTSHEAHFCERHAPHSLYALVAASKYAGEQRLRALKDLVQTRGAQLNVISGDIVPDSATGKLLEYRDPGILERRRALVGTLPTTRDFADRIEALCAQPLPEFAAVSFVWEPFGYPA